MAEMYSEEVMRDILIHQQRNIMVGMRPEMFWIKFRDEDTRKSHFPGYFRWVNGWFESTNLSWNYLFSFRDEFITSGYTRSQSKRRKLRHKKQMKRLMNELLLVMGKRKHKEIYKNVLEELGLVPGIGQEYKQIQKRFKNKNY